MAIYGRFGVELKIKRRAVLVDVQRLDHRKPDKQDKEAIAAGSYWVVDFVDLDALPGKGGQDRLYHLGYMRADGGIKEIDAACKAAEFPATREVCDRLDAHVCTDVSNRLKNGPMETVYYVGQPADPGAGFPTAHHVTPVFFSERRLEAYCKRNLPRVPKPADEGSDSIPDGLLESWPVLESA